MTSIILNFLIHNGSEYLKTLSLTLCLFYTPYLKSFKTIRIQNLQLLTIHQNFQKSQLFKTYIIRNTNVFKGPKLLFTNSVVPQMLILLQTLISPMLSFLINTFQLSPFPKLISHLTSNGKLQNVSLK